MVTAGVIIAVLAAVLHGYIFVMESLTWTSPRTRAVFGTTAEEAQTTKALAFNQGFYNLFLAVGVLVGVLLQVSGDAATVSGPRSTGSVASTDPTANRLAGSSVRTSTVTSPRRPCGRPTRPTTSRMTAQRTSSASSRSTRT